MIMIGVLPWKIDGDQVMKELLMSPFQYAHWAMSEKTDEKSFFNVTIILNGAAGAAAAAAEVGILCQGRVQGSSFAAI